MTRKKAATPQTDPNPPCGWLVGGCIWSLNEVIEWRESRGDIVPPFSTEERLLAERLASAWYFFSDQMELPARAAFESGAGGAYWMAIYRVQKLRKEQATSPATRR